MVDPSPASAPAAYTVGSRAMRVIADLARRRAAYWVAIAVVIAAGGYLRLPALEGSLLGDDWDHYAMATGLYPVQRHPLDMYNFVGQSAPEHAALLRSGRLPWWSDPKLHVAFLRPLSSALLYVDYVWLRADKLPERAHAHSAAWWAASVVALAGLLACLLPRHVALVATALYALDDAHAWPVAWIAHRSELIAVALMLAALWVHVACSQRQCRGGRVLSVALVSCAMLAGEYAVALFAYFAAYELFVGPRGVSAQLRRSVPIAAPVVLYVLLRSAMGYGTAGSGFYFDPFADPVGYLQEGARHVPLLLADVVFGYAAEWWYGAPWLLWFYEEHLIPDAWLSPFNLHAMHLGLGILALGLVLAAIERLRRAHASDQRALAWLLTGSLLSLLPLCGASAMTRLTLAPAIAVHAAFGFLVIAAARKLLAPGPWAMRALAGVSIACVIALHGVHAGTRSREDATSCALRSRVEQRWALSSEIDNEGVSKRHVIIVSARDVTTLFSLPYVRVAAGMHAPISAEVMLPHAEGEVILQRMSDRVLDVTFPDAVADARFRNSVFRLDASAFRVGQRMDARTFSVEVLEVARSTPTRLRFWFAKPLEDPAYVFLYPRPEGNRRLMLPRVGERITLPPPAWLSLTPT